MGYLSSFENDIFISYARVDDQAAPGNSKGWVTLLHEHLKFQLSRRFGKIDIIKIWRDTREIDGSTFFDEAIQTNINSSALFLALNSRGYIESEYCRKELRLFYDKANAEPHGLKLGSRSRLINLLLFDIPPKEWPDEISGTSGVKFHDGGQHDRSAQPTLQESELFQEQLHRLADEIEKTIRAFKKILGPAEPDRKKPDAAGDSVTVFLAHTEGHLLDISRRVSHELQQQFVHVVTDIPPPYESEAHAKEVTAAMRQAHLSVHLLDDARGRDVMGEPGKPIVQKQVEIGLQSARSQLIWLPKMLDLQNVGDNNYRSFLDDLENGSRQQGRYSLIRESPSAISREILAKLHQLKAATEASGSSSSAVLVDTHVKDQKYALDLGTFLAGRRIQPYISPREDSPQKNIGYFQQMLKQVSALIIIFGSVAPDWVYERLNCALQIATAERCQLRLCGIYMVPLNGDGNDREVRLTAFPEPIPIIVFERPEELAGALLSAQ